MARGRRVALVLFALSAALAVLHVATRPDPRDEVRWTGTVRLLGGSAARGPGIVRLYGEDGAAIAVPYDLHGRFDVRVAPGTYEALLEPRGEDREPVAFPGTLSVCAGACVRDVAFPAGVVRGTVLRASTKQPVVGWGRTMGLSHAGDVLLLTQTASLDEDGTFRLDGVLPGRYFVEGTVQRFYDRDGEPVIADVSSTTPEVVLELVVHF